MYLAEPYGHQVLTKDWRPMSVAAAIRAVYQQRGEFSAGVELQRRSLASSTTRRRGGACAPLQAGNRAGCCHWERKRCADLPRMLSSTAILAVCATLRQLAWTHDWHVREDCYAAALAQLIEAHRRLPLARVGAMGLPPVPMDNFTVGAIAAKLWATSMPDTATSPATRSIPTTPTSLGRSTPKSLQPRFCQRSRH